VFKGVAKSLSHYAKFRSVGISGGEKWKNQTEALAKPVDLVVATPGRLLKHNEKGNLLFTEVVMDEADTMFGKGFEEDMEVILKPIKVIRSIHKCMLM
jgi:superfamily II DNA/RNA helicase